MGHLFRECSFYRSGLPSKNPAWNYASSGPVNFQTASPANAVPQLSATTTAIVPYHNPMQHGVPENGPHGELGEALQMMHYICQRETEKVLAEEKAATLAKEKADKLKEWNETMEEVQKHCVTTTKLAVDAAMKVQLSPIKRAFDFLKNSYGQVPKTGRVLDLNDEDEEDEEVVPPAAKRLKKAGISMRKAKDYENDDSEALFKYVAGYESGGNTLNWKVYMSVMRINTGEELREWVKTHMKEGSPRELSYLQDLAATRNLKVQGHTKRATLIKKLADDYDATLQDV